MKFVHFSGALAILLLAACTAHQPVVQTFPELSASCGPGLRTLNGAEIARLIVGMRVQYAQERKECSLGIIITSPQWLDLHRDGTASFRTDRWGKAGKYLIADDRLCVILPQEDKACERLYTDARGTVYMMGPLIGEDGPVAIEVSDYSAKRN